MDTVLRGATLVDGTGSAARKADVGIDGGRIAAVGKIGASEAKGADTVGLDGLLLCPGFIDAHTHLDAQVLWDPELAPSTWHGVTSVILGNCGFGLAPMREEHRGTMLRTLENVEGMSVEALEAGITWEFETFPQYLAALDRRGKRCNVGVLVGHTPLRLYVMGRDCMDRAANPAEIQQIRQLVAEALDAGAVGLSSSVSPVHIGEGGRPVPSRLAQPEEIVEICRPLRDGRRGVFQVTAGPTLDREELAALSKQIERPVLYAAVLTGFHGQQSALSVLEELKSLGGDVWACVSCKPVKFQFNMEDPFPFANTLRSFTDVLSVARSERGSVYRDPAWRARARAEAEAHPQWRDRFPKTRVAESPAHPRLVDGPPMTVLAADRGVTPFDVVVDIALEDHLATRFDVIMFNDDERAVAPLLSDNRTLITLSDAGAHASQMCDANFTTWLLGHWVRDLGVLDMPQAVHELTARPAAIFGLTDRGVVEAGRWADLVAFDADAIGTEPSERIWDLPAGADRVVARSRGIEWTWVNGVATRRHGTDGEGTHPGVVLRA
jgi:N-acyl-D-aspartate/D-glutamate deacylase